jgi:hypothetical protein
MNQLPLSLRVVIGILGLALVAWRIHSRWRAASEHSDAMALETQTLRAIHAQLLAHPAWHRLGQALAARGVQVSPEGPRPGAFHFGLLTLWTQTGYAMRVDAPAAWIMNAYLQGPKRIVASLVLATGEVQVREATFGEWPTQAF